MAALNVIKQSLQKVLKQYFKPPLQSRSTKW